MHARAIETVQVYSYKRKYLENGSSHGLTGSAQVLGSARATAEPASAEPFSTLLSTVPQASSFERVSCNSS
ncbi:hypothetical protein PsorP6_001871 [Peronosclerospora sorghi]|uniref:Uncharacterized protein n=1 Tax=Peronosclerospora sorghi TaxID=230839 RepID=A0ACC0WU89_9STRA|nr:hypothetical protein PsorP6_001871 [Peronosclerospora sorghi]